MTCDGLPTPIGSTGILLRANAVLRSVLVRR